MAKFSKLETLVTIKETRLIPIFYHKDITTAKQVVKACYMGGIRVFEFTNRGEFASEVFAKLAKFVLKECPGLILGIGSVVDAGTAALYLQLGANFIVSPCFNVEVAKICNRRLIPYIPGCGTVSEIGNANEAGCDICKVFPAENLGGPSFIKNIQAPMPWLQLMVTGGVNAEEENLKEWILGGAMCVGIGSKLFPKERINSNEWDEITRLCREALAVINKYSNI